MSSHYRLNLNLNVEPLKQALDEHPELFDEHNQRRTAPGSPHAQMTDIWLRYNTIPEDGDFSHFADEHDSQWYPAIYQLPEALNIIFQVMAFTLGERLGGVLITKLPPGGEIVPHIDGGWHADYYDKYYVPIKNAKGAVFCFPDGVIEPEEGAVWFFDNHVQHSVINKSNDERLAMIICLRRTL